MSETSKVVLVTGATGGIGSAVCARLAHAGYSLILAARDIGKLQAACAKLQRLGGQSFRWISVDMSSDASVVMFSQELAAEGTVLNGVVLVPPQMRPTGECQPPAETWR